MTVSEELAFTDSVFDSVHGYIPLTSVEQRIIRLPVFQRLRHIKQMGLASLVFPGAEHTRFAHSLGVMHIVWKFTQALELKKEERQTLRLAALLHDIGHLPLSHALEDCVYDHWVKAQRSEAAMETLLEGGLPEDPPEGATSATDGKLHEMLGRDIIMSDRVAPLIEDEDISPATVAGLGTGDVGDQDPSAGSEDVKLLRLFRSLFRSEIDADRIDYLLRDAASSGLPAAGCDLGRLYREVTWSNEGAGFKIDGLRALEQLLLARFLNYRCIVLNKHVMGYEHMAKAVFAYSLGEGHTPSYPKLLSFLRNEPFKFYRVNDHLYANTISEIAVQPGKRPDHIVTMAKQLASGEGMKLIWEDEVFGTEDEWDNIRAHSPIESVVEDLKAFCTKVGVEQWEIQLVEPTRPLKVVDCSGDTDVTIEYENGEHCSLLTCPSSLLRHVSSLRLHLRRLYALNPGVLAKVEPVFSRWHPHANAKLVS